MVVILQEKIFGKDTTYTLVLSYLIIKIVTFIFTKIVVDARGQMIEKKYVKLESKKDLIESLERFNEYLN